jgi:tetratricopeptide (TPR) repeat protein
MRGIDYFRRIDPALEAIWSEPVPYPNVIGILRDSGATNARRLWEKLRSRYADFWWWEPWRWSDLNAVSYELLEHGRTEDAFTGFLINTERSPQIWETWDSLGEGYLKAGRKVDALASYQRALQIDPHNWNASEQRRIVADLRVGKPQ